MPAELHDLQAVQGDVPDDLSRLPSLEEERVRNALQKRFERNQIYTHINSLLGARRLCFCQQCATKRAAVANNAVADRRSSAGTAGG